MLEVNSIFKLISEIQNIRTNTNCYNKELIIITYYSENLFELSAE